MLVPLTSAISKLKVTKDKETKFRRLQGCAPKGDLERQVQKFIDGETLEMAEED